MKIRLKSLSLWVALAVLQAEPSLARVRPPDRILIGERVD